MQVNDTVQGSSALRLLGELHAGFPDPGQGVGWDLSSLTVNGNVRVSSVTNVSPRAQHRRGPHRQYDNLSWPPDQLGWTLQTNAVA